MPELISDPAERHAEADEDVTKPYAAFNKDTECWIIGGRGAFAFRFGPYTPEEAGAVLTEATERRITVTLVSNCGRDVDWDLLRDVGMKLVLKGDPGWKAPETSAQAGDSDNG